MSVRRSLLAILDQGPCYGYQLRAEFERRTGATWPLNVGQIYNTLDRLERDGLVAKDAVDAHGHVYWRITDAGVADVRRWLTHPVEQGVPRDELAIKAALASTLPGADVETMLADQLRTSASRLERVSSEEPPHGAGDSPEALAWGIIHDARVSAAEAEVRWLERALDRLSRHPDHALQLALSTERPRRGRPVGSGA